MPNDPTYVSDHECGPDQIIRRGYYADTLLRNALRYHFETRPLAAFAGHQHLHWTPEVNQGQPHDTPGSLRIDLHSAWNPSKADAYPAIIIRQGDMGSIRLGMDDRHMSPGNISLAGTRTYTRAWTGSTAIFCLSRNARESWLLGLTVGEYLEVFAKQLQEVLHMKKLEVSTVKAPKPLREQPTILATPVIVQYGFISTWHITPAAPTLARIHLKSD